MKKKILVIMTSLNVGGAERSLIGLLENLNYEKYEIDLFLYRQEGQFMKHIPKYVNLLKEIPEYTTFERPIKDILLEKHYTLSAARIFAKLMTKINTLGMNNEKKTYKQLQYTWHYSMKSLPNIKKKYDVAISFLGPHSFIVDKVKADIKLGWNHTDYSTIVNPDISLDRRIWSKLNYIINVSDACKESFLKIFPDLSSKSIVLENIISSNFVIEQSNKVEEIKDLYLTKETINICSVGRLSYAKGFDIAIHVLKELLKMNYKIKWYIVGSGGEKEKLQQLIKENNLEDSFILLGERENPYPIMKKCDIYCQPSRYEGKAVTVREAQIIGKPVIITNYPTSSSQLEDGIDGLISDMTVSGLVNSIIKIITNSNLRETLITNCMIRDYSNIKEINTFDKIINNDYISQTKEAVI